MYEWLKDIGSRNRQHLRTMTADIPRPEPLGTDTYGARTLYNSYSAFPRVHSVVNINTAVREVSYHLDPAIEAIFRILGERRVRLSLELLLGKYLPGVELWEDGQEDDHYRWGDMDMPGEIQRVRGLYASRVDVLYRCQGLRSKHVEQRDLIQKQGWKIIDEKEALLPVTPDTYFDIFTNQTRTIPQASIIQYSLSR